jgi:hypothetical protein
MPMTTLNFHKIYVLNCRAAEPLCRALVCLTCVNPVEWLLSVGLPPASTVTLKLHISYRIQGICFVPFQNKLFISLNSINPPVSVKETQCIFCHYEAEF